MKKKDRKRIKKALIRIVESSDGLTAPSQASIDAAKLLLKRF